MIRQHSNLAESPLRSAKAQKGKALPGPSLGSWPEQPRKPDWLLIWVSLLFLSTVLIAWLVDIPALLR